jgi:hypothetical protein
VILTGKCLDGDETGDCFQELMAVFFVFILSKFLLAFSHMWNIKFKKVAVLVCVLLLQPMLSPGSFALAKKKKAPMKAYSFIAEGGKASQGECDGERKIPKLKKIKDFAKYGAYMGSELQETELKTKANEEMWKHFFKDKGSCGSVLAKTPSALDNKTLKDKPELPPEDSDSDNDTDQPEKPDQADGPDSE